MLFVDLSESGDPLNDINALAEVCEPGTVVIASGQVNDVRLYRDLVASGIQDYLLKPLNPDALRDAFAQAQAVLNAPKLAEQRQRRPHCAVAVIGTRGGVRRVDDRDLARLAAERQACAHDRVARSRRAFRHRRARARPRAGPRPDRRDRKSEPHRRAVHRTRDGEGFGQLAVLSAEAPINAPVLTDGAAFYQLQEEMRGAFECTVVDLPRNMLVHHPHLITDVQVAVLVTELTLAAARDAIRILSWFKSNAPQTQVIVVANKVQPQAVLEISRKDFEGSIERKIDLLIPFEQKVAAQAAKLGKPLAEAGKRPSRSRHWRTSRPRITVITDSGERDDKAAPRQGIEGQLAVRQDQGQDAVKGKEVTNPRLGCAG